jgi:DNA (cytosine-5)-methyltransferase 1
MGLLRGYGNAIVPPLAAEFVTEFLQSLPDGLR